MALFNRQRFFARYLNLITKPTERDTLEFVRHMIWEGMEYHWDDDPHEIIEATTGTNLFTREEANALEVIIPRLMRVFPTPRFECLFDLTLRLSPIHPYQPPAYERIKVGFDDFDEEDYITAYTNGRKWNGWAMPVFRSCELGKLLRIIAPDYSLVEVSGGGILSHYLSSVENNWEDVEVRKFEVSDFQGNIHQVYDINDLGLCFEAVCEL